MVEDLRFAVLVDCLGCVCGVGLPVAKPSLECWRANNNPLPLIKVRSLAVRRFEPSIGAAQLLGKRLALIFWRLVAHRTTLRLLSCAQDLCLHAGFCDAVRLHVAGQRGLEGGPDLGHVVDQLRASAGVCVAAQVARHGVDGAVQEFGQLGQDLLCRTITIGFAHLGHDVCPEGLVCHQVAAKVGDQLLHDLAVVVPQLAVGGGHGLAVHAASDHSLNGGVRLWVVALELVHQLVAKHHYRRHAGRRVQVDRALVVGHDEAIAHTTGVGAGIELHALAEGLGDSLDHGALLLADARRTAAAGH